MNRIRRGQGLRTSLSAMAMLAAFLLWLPRDAPAQTINTDNVFVGYSFFGANLFSGQHADLNGWNISGEKKYLPFFGVVGDVSGLYGATRLPGPAPCPASGDCLVRAGVSLYTFDLGIRGSYGTSTIRPFAEALFGEVHTVESGLGVSNTNNGFDAMLGAGLDCRLTRLLGCRDRRLRGEAQQHPRLHGSSVPLLMGDHHCGRSA
jgi:hypothetical protein